MRALAPLLLLPGLALAQPGLLVQSATPPRGVTLPPTSAALVDEATSLSVNPAGLRFSGAGQLFYLHERNLEHAAVGDALYLGTTLFDGLGLGLGLDWMRGRGLPDYRKTSLGLALGSGRLSLGVGYTNYASDDGALDRLSTFDLGLTLRPARAFSLGAVIKDVNAPSEGLYTLPRRYSLAVGVRPLGERLSLGADYTATEGAWDAGRLSYTVNATVEPGVRLGAGLAHGVGTDTSLALQFSLTLDSSHLGLTYAGGGLRGGSVDHLLAVRLSADKYPALRLGGGSVALLDLDDRLAERGGIGLSLLGVPALGPVPGAVALAGRGREGPEAQGRGAQGVGPAGRGLGAGGRAAPGGAAAARRRANRCWRCSTAWMTGPTSWARRRTRCTPCPPRRCSSTACPPRSPTWAGRWRSWA